MSICTDCKNGHHSATAVEACSCPCHPGCIEDARRPFPTELAFKWTCTALAVGATLWGWSFLSEFFTWRIAAMTFGAVAAFPAALAVRFWIRMGTRLLMQAAALKSEQYFVAREAERRKFSDAIEQGFARLRAEIATQ